MNDYSARRAVFPTDRATVIELWRGNLGDPARVDAKFNWYYSSSPTGEPLTVLLDYRDASNGADSVAVGVAALGPRRFCVGATPVTAGVLIDMTVTARHRTLFPALTLQKALFQASQKQAALLYGFPNSKAAPVFQRAGYTRLGALTRYVRVLRSGAYLRKWIPQWLAYPGGWVLDVLNDARRKSTGAIGLRWDAQFAVNASYPETVDGRPLARGARDGVLLRWRFGAHTGRRFACIEASHGERPVGYWVVEYADDVLLVKDAAPALFAEANAAAWTRLFREARRRRFNSVSFECLAPEPFAARLLALGMKARGERPVFSAIRADHADMFAGAAWYLTEADEDE